MSVRGRLLRSAGSDGRNSDGTQTDTKLPMAPGPSPAITRPIVGV
jgi:hypothetical protein